MMIDMMNVLLNTSRRGALGILAHFISYTTYAISSTPPTTIMAISEGLRQPFSAYVLREKGRSSSDQPKPRRMRPKASISCQLRRRALVHGSCASAAVATTRPRGDVSSCFSAMASAAARRAALLDAMLTTPCFLALRSR